MLNCLKSQILFDVGKIKYLPSKNGGNRNGKYDSLSLIACRRLQRHSIFRLSLERDTELEKLN